MPQRTNHARTFEVVGTSLRVTNEMTGASIPSALDRDDARWLIEAIAGMHGHEVTITDPKVYVTDADQLQPGVILVAPTGKETIIVGLDPRHRNRVIYTDGSNSYWSWHVPTIVTDGRWWIKGSLADPITGFAKGDRVVGTPSGRAGVVVRATPLTDTRVSVSVRFDGFSSNEEVSTGLLVREKKD